MLNFAYMQNLSKKKHCASVLKRVAHFYDDKTKINGKNNKDEAIIKIKVMLRCLCSASSIFPVVYLIKTTTTTRKMEDPELRPFRMTPVLFNNRKAKTIRSS